MTPSLTRLGHSLRFEILAAVVCAALPRLAGAEEPPAAQEAHPVPADTYRIEVPRLKGAPAIDGSIEGEPVWQEAAHVSGFTQIEPRDGDGSTERTEVYVGYDSRNLYVAFRCWASDASKIVASAMNRDANLEWEDRVEIAIDTFQDHQNAFLFVTNALGAVADGTIRDDGEDIRWAWDAVWSVASSRDAKGWTAEFAIPFSSLRFENTSHPAFNLNFGRYIASKHELTFWKPLQYNQGLWSSRYKVSKYGEATGFAGIEAANLFDARPYVLLGASGTGPALGDALKNGGVDIKIPITSSLVTDLTLNPDFAEAELDAPVVNLSRYPVMLPEKREFFKEGESLFYFGDRIDATDETNQLQQFRFFQSRQIGLAGDGQEVVPVFGGGRITGKVGPVGLGLLNLTTSEFHDATTGTDVPLTNYSALRLKYDLPGGSTVGLMGLNQQGADGSYNRGLGVDANVILGDSLRLGGYLVKTLSPGLTNDDYAGSADFVFQTKYFLMRGVYNDFGANFNPEMGYLTRTGFRKYEISPTFTVSSDFLHILHADLFYDGNFITDREGNLQTRYQYGELVVFFTNGYALALIPKSDLEVINAPFRLHKDVVVPAGTYDFSSLFLGLGTDFNAPVSTVLWLEGGQLWGGTEFHARLLLIMQPGAGFTFQGFYDRLAATLPWGSFVSDVVSASARYAFSPKVSTRAMVQYYSDDFARANLLLIWNYLPGANIYLIGNYERDLRGDQPWRDNFMAALKVTYSWGLSPDQKRPAAPRLSLSSSLTGAPDTDGALSADGMGRMGSGDPRAMRAGVPRDPVR